MRKQILQRTFLSFTLLITLGWCKAQVGIGTNTPTSAAVLQVSSTSKGMLAPKMNASQRSSLGTVLNGISQTITKGMMVLDSTSGMPFYWNGTAWRDVTNYTGTAPVNVNLTTNTIALNPGTNPGDLMSWNGSSWINISGNTYVKPTASNMQPYLVLNYCISLFGIYPSQNGADPFVGEIQLYGFNFAPKGFAQCNGLLLPIAQYQALFTLLGTQYGGNGQTTFALPDLRGRVAIHQGQGPGLPQRFIGETGGSVLVPFQ